MGRTISLISIGAAGLLVAVVVYQQRELTRLQGEVRRRPRAAVTARSAPPLPLARWDAAPAPAPAAARTTASPAAPTATLATPPASSEARSAAAPPPVADKASPESKLRANLHRIAEYERQRDLSVPEGRTRWVQTLAAGSGLTAEQSAGLSALLDQEFEQRKDIGAEARSSARGYGEALADARQIHADTDVKVRKLLTDAQFRAYVRSRAFSGPDSL